MPLKYTLSPEELAEKLKTQSATQIARDLGCAKSTVFYHMRKHDLCERPYRKMYEEEIPKYIERECKKHGMTRYILNASHDRRWYRCIQCASAASRARKRDKKLKLIDALGGRCTVCGYNACSAALDFHHLEPSDKEHDVVRLLSHSYEKALAEARKCVLLCARCHREVEDGFTVL